MAGERLEFNVLMLVDMTSSMVFIGPSNDQYHLLVSEDNSNLIVNMQHSKNPISIEYLVKI